MQNQVILYRINFAFPTRIALKVLISLAAAVRGGGRGEDRMGPAGLRRPASVRAVRAKATA